MAGTAAPTSRTIALATKESGLITVIPAIIVKITLPQLLNAFAIVTPKLCVGITITLVANIISLITAVHAICITITFPGPVDAAT
jgi:hypothetical protein